MPKAAILIPLYKDDLTLEESVSLQQCFAILGKHTIIFLAPNKLQSGKIHRQYKAQSEFIFLDDMHFKTLATYNHMLLRMWFYKLFVQFDYILIYHLDAFVFRDELDFWMEKQYSYIGAPWFMGNSNDEAIDEFFGVGNGGFSLRHVKNTIKVLQSNKKVWGLRHIIQQRKSNKLKGLLHYFLSESFKTIHKNPLFNEDKVFCQAGKRFDFFKIPPPEEAIAFAFEKQSWKLFKRNHNQLPFGCHAWPKFDPDFYVPHIERYGYNLNELKNK